MLTPEIAGVHFAYSAWASQRVVDAAGKLSDEELRRDHKSADKSVLGTLVHTFAADRIWYARVTGAPITKFVDESDHDMAVLRSDWPTLYSDWAKFLAGADLGSVIPYKDMKGNPYETPLWQIVLHVVNHGSHHRGMVAAMLRAMGQTPPPLDEIAYFRQLAK